MYRYAIFLSTLSGISSSIKTSEGGGGAHVAKRLLLLDFYSLPSFFLLHPNFFSTFPFKMPVQNLRIGEGNTVL